MQIIDRRTVAVPGPMGDVTPAAVAAQDAAVAAAASADASRVQAQAAQVAAVGAQGAAELAADSILSGDWADLSSYIVSPFSGELWGILTGRGVELSGSISGDVASSSSILTFTSAIPVDYRATIRNRWGAAAGAGAAGASLGRPDGTLGVANRSGVDWTAFQFSLLYFK